MSAPSIAMYENWIDRHVVDNDGHRVGIVADIYLDDASGYPEWLAVMTGLFGSRLSFVPISGAVEAGGKVCVAFSKAFVKDSPNIDTDGTLNVEDEQRLYRHYGMRYATLTPGASGPPAEEPKMSGRRRLRRRHEKVGNDIDLRSQSDEKASST